MGKARRCPSYKKVDEKSRAKRVPIYYKDGTVDAGYGRVPVAKQEAIDAAEAEASEEPKQEPLDW